MVVTFSSERKPVFEFGIKLNRIKDVLKPTVQDGLIQRSEDEKPVEGDETITEIVRAEFGNHRLIS